MAKAFEKAGPNGKITGALVQTALGEITKKPKRDEEFSLKTNWQCHLEPLLNDALRLTRLGDQEAVAEIVERVSLLLLVGRRPLESGPHLDPISVMKA